MEASASCATLARDQDQVHAEPGGALQAIVLDTNVVLDLFIFSDPATADLRQALHAGALRWIATAPMREELRRVLDYAQLQPRMAFYGITSEQVLAAFDRHAVLCDEVPKAAYTCKDADDQKFIDLAAAHQARLISKDKAVLCMAKRMRHLDVRVSRTYEADPMAPSKVCLA